MALAKNIREIHLFIGTCIIVGLLLFSQDGVKLFIKYGVTEAIAQFQRFFNGSIVWFQRFFNCWVSGQMVWNGYFRVMATKRKCAMPTENRPSKNYRIYWWIISIGLMLMALVWLYFEKYSSNL